MEANKKITVYLAGPITIPCPLTNAKIGIQYADTLMSLGYVPFVPHLSVLWQMVGQPKGHAEWLEYDFCWVALCDCLLRIPGESKGADMEVTEANRLGKPVFYTIDDMQRHYKGDGC